MRLFTRKWPANIHKNTIKSLILLNYLLQFLQILRHRPYLIWSLDGLVQRMCKAKFLLYACAEMSS